MHPSLVLGSYLDDPADAHLGRSPYAHLSTWELAAFLAGWEEIHAAALSRIRHRIHPTAYIHPRAIVGDDVIIGPHAKIWENTTIRKGAVIGAGATIGFGCEVTQAYVGEETVLGHRIALGRTIVGNRVHLSADVIVAAISLWNVDMRTPERQIAVRVSDGLYRCGTPRFGGLIGDRCQTGNRISLGPGVFLGRGCRIASGVILAGRAIPESSTVSAPHTAETHVRPQRRGR